MVDPNYNDMLSLMKSIELNNNVQARYDKDVFLKQAKFYMELMNNAGNGRFSLGFYRTYPWTRFTIFDDQKVSFIITPNTIGGKFTYRYFSSDPLVVNMFEKIYEKIKRCSFTSKDASTLKRFIDDKNSWHSAKLNECA